MRKSVRGSYPAGGGGGSGTGSVGVVIAGAAARISLLASTVKVGRGGDGAPGGSGGAGGLGAAGQAGQTGTSRGTACTKVLPCYATLPDVVVQAGNGSKGGNGGAGAAGGGGAGGPSIAIARVGGGISVVDADSTLAVGVAGLGAGVR